MFNLNDNSKIFVCCPAGVVTGGIELLHQLVHILNENGRKAYILYTGQKPYEIPADYLCYNIQLADKIEDETGNVVVLFEPVMHLALKMKHINIVLWWLSVDNFYLINYGSLSFRDSCNFSFNLAVKSVFLKLYNILLSNKSQKYSVKDLLRVNAVAAYQSEYARHHLQQLGFKNIVALKDYINTEHHNDDYSCREDIVLYNPKKGMKFTKKLIKMAPHIRWTPIQNMSRHEVIQLMGRAKVYIDFGNHPGKDRLPRECALNGLCIVTGMRGAAAFYEDVMLQPKYKFDERTADKKLIINCIEDLLDNYPTRIHDFKEYRDMIMREKREFEEQVKLIF